jgi:hypothetical protein
MCFARAASEHEHDMTARTCNGACATFLNDKRSGDTNGEGINAFGGSWFAVSPAGAKVAPRWPPQGGGGYGGY